MHVTTIVPHGDIPDRRGFAPAIVAQELAIRYRVMTPSFIALQEWKEPAMEWWHGIPVLRYRQSRLYRRLFTKMSRLDPWPLERRLVPMVRQLDPQVLHIHQLEFPILRFQKLLGRRIPVVLHVHAMRTFDESRGVADRYIAVSEFTRREMVERRGFPEERVVVVHNGVDTDLFRPPGDEERGELRDLLGIRRDAVVLGYVGRRQAPKGYHRYLALLERLVEEREDLVGLVVGPEPQDAQREEGWAEARARHDRLVATGRLVSLPAVTHRHLSQIYRALDIVVSMTISD